MKTDSSITRREAMLHAFRGSVAATIAIPFITNAVEPASPPEPEFVQENDYPFFGYEPESIS